MTHPNVVEEREDGHPIVVTAAQLAAIQHSYEKARACIAGLAGSSGHGGRPDADPHPDTEAIDIRLVRPPAAYEATPPTTAMSVAARSLAERPIVEGTPPRVDPSGPTPERHTTRHGVRASHIQTQASHDARGPRRWWRAVRTSLPRAVPATR